MAHNFDLTDDERLFSTKDAAAYLGIGESTLRNALTRGAFPKPEYKYNNKEKNATETDKDNKYARNKWTLAQLKAWLETKRNWS